MLPIVTNSAFSFPRLPLNKRDRIKPLQLGDVMVAFINQRHTNDATHFLREYLQFATLHSVQQQTSTFLDDLIMLPDFAIKEQEECQLLAYHLARGNWDRHQNYQSLLAEVEQRLGNLMVSSTLRIEESQVQIEELKGKMRETYETVKNRRGVITRLKALVNEHYLRIVRAIRKQDNLRKTLEIVKMWNRCNLARILRFQPEQMQPSQVGQIMAVIVDAITSLEKQQVEDKRRNSGQLSSESFGIQNILQLIRKKKEAIVAVLYRNMCESVILFTDTEQYSVLYLQYQCVQPHLPPGLSCPFQNTSLLQLLDEDGQKIFQTALASVSSLHSVDLLSESEYLSFMAVLLEQYKKYYVSWHKITSYHVTMGTPHVQTFIGSRAVVCIKMIGKVTALVNYSPKLLVYTFRARVALAEMLWHFLRSSQEWMGGCCNNLVDVLYEKFNSQGETFRKVVNGQLKGLLLEHLAEGRDQQPQEYSLEVEMARVGKEYSFHGIDLEKVIELLKEGRQKKDTHSLSNTNTAHTHSLSNTSHFVLQNNYIPPNPNSHTANSVLKVNFHKQPFLAQGESLPSVTQRLSRRLLVLIHEYRTREHIATDQCCLDSLYSHFQYICLIVYKIFAHPDLTNCLSRNYPCDKRLETIRNLFGKPGSVQEWDDKMAAVVNEIREECLRRRDFRAIAEFIRPVQDRIDSLIITGCVSVQKWYDNYSANEQLVTRTIAKLIAVSRELLLVSEYLVNISSGFRLASQQLLEKVALLPTVLIELCLAASEGHLREQHRKLGASVTVPFNSLRWQIKKYSNQTEAMFKEYKVKLIEGFHMLRHSLVEVLREGQCEGTRNRSVGAEHQKESGDITQALSVTIQARHYRLLFHLLLELYCRIDKINDNGRQLVRLDYINICRALGLPKPVSCQAIHSGQLNMWCNWMDKYIQLSNERNSQVLLEQISHTPLLYPMDCWMRKVSWAYNDFSSRQRKDYISKVIAIYSKAFEEEFLGKTMV